MTEALDDALLATVVGIMDSSFTVEGAIVWLMAENPYFGGRSAAHLLLNGEEALVVDTLREVAVNA